MKEALAGTVRKSRKFKILVILFMAVSLGMFSTFHYVKAQIEDRVLVDAFYPGITVEGVYLEGMSLEEAEAAISAKVEQYFDGYGLLIGYQDKEWQFDHTYLAMTSNYKDVLQQAYAIGREGTLLERYDVIRALMEEPVSYTVELAFTTEGLARQLDEIAREINREAVDATISFHPREKEKFIITQDETGLFLDVDALMKKINSGFKEGVFLTVTLEPEVVLPDILAAELALQTEKIAVFHTNVSGTSARKHNVFLAGSQFNGMVVMPGETISFNETTGQRTSGNGYRAAPVIMADKSLQDSLGGGVCQTSTAIYNAVLRAGLRIEERRHHSFPSTYINIGHDAAVSWASVDMKFTNDGAAPVYIHTYRSGDRLYVEIYGRALEDADEVRLVSNVYEQFSAPSPSVVKDTKQQYVRYVDERYTHAESRAGYKVKTHRVFLKDGQEVRRELISDDYYRPISGIVYVGVQERPAPEPEQETEPVTEE